ncbi:MAG: hypothetical protein PVI86_11325 [Phycisphaerae bacterium]
MNARRAIVVLLVGLNLLLLLALVVATQPGAAAYAQSGARAGDFVCVTAKAASQSYDVLYVLDVPGRKLYGFYPANRSRGTLVGSPPRDLAKDFQRQ